MALLIVLFYVSANACSVGSNFWLSAWTDDVPVNGTYDPRQRNLRLGIYALLGFSQGEYLGSGFVIVCLNYLALS